MDLVTKNRLLRLARKYPGCREDLKDLISNSKRAFELRDHERLMKSQKDWILSRKKRYQKQMLTLIHEVQFWIEEVFYNKIPSWVINRLYEIQSLSKSALRDTDFSPMSNYGFVLSTMVDVSEKAIVNMCFRRNPFQTLFHLDVMFTMMMNM